MAYSSFERPCKIYDHLYIISTIQIMQVLRPLVDSYHLTVGAALTLSHNEAGTQNASNSFKQGFNSAKQRIESLTAFWVHGYVGANSSMPRDEFEAQILEDLVEGNISMIYVDYESKLDAQITLGEFDMVNFCLQTNVECIATKEKKERVDSKIFKYTESFLRLDKLLSCQNVRFSSKEYKITKSYSTNELANTKVSLQLGDTPLEFSEFRDLNQMSIDKDHILSVCKDLLDSALQNLDEERRQKFYSRGFQAEADDITQVQYYATLVCVGASMTCLFLALMTYFLFNVLRSVAGINNIFLCGSLLMAQASLLASVHV